MVNPIAQALQPLQPFLWGRGGAQMTPEQIAREREIAEALGAVDTSPVDHWLQGAARMANAAVGRIREGRASAAERDNAAYNQDVIAGLLGGVTPASVVSNPGNTSSMATMPAPDYASARVAQAHNAGSPLPNSFLSAVDSTEGAGGYDTLFGHAQRGPFAGTDVSQMTIGDALAFASPSGAYGQHVKRQIGRVATPMGRHQIVGTTLRNAVQEMGLDPSMPFDANTQDTIAAHLARRRIASADTMDGKIAALRSEWEGLKNVPRSQMEQIVRDLEATPAAQPSASGLTPEALQAWGATAYAPMPAGGALDAVNALGAAQPVPVAETEADILAQEAAMAQQDPAAFAPQEVAGSPVAAALTNLLVNPDMPMAGNTSGFAPVQQQAGGINPAIIQALSDPRASEQTRQIAGLLLNQQMQAQDPMRQLEMQKMQRELSQGQPLINAGGGFLYNPNDGQWISAPNAGQEATPDAVRALQMRAEMAGLQPGTQEFADFMISGGKGPLVNVDVGGGEKFGEEFAKGDASALAEVSQSGMAAQRNLARIDRLDQILKNTPQGAMASWQQMAGQYGINTEGLDNIQAAQALINALVPEQRPPGSGPMSDADLELFKQSLPRIINQPGGNEMIVNTMRAIAQYDAEGANIVQALRRGEIDRAQAFEALQARTNPLAGLNDIITPSNAPKRREINGYVIEQVD